MVRRLFSLKSPCTSSTGPAASRQPLWQNNRESPEETVLEAVTIWLWSIVALGMTVCWPAKALTQDIDCFVLYEVIAFLFLTQQELVVEGMWSPVLAGTTCSTLVGSFLKNY